MTNDRTRRASSRPSDGELLAAYLAADLDDAEVARLEERLAGDADLRARLDATAEVLFALQGIDDVDEPEGYADRLTSRLEAERPAGTSPVVSLEGARRRAARGGAWVAWSGAAAAVLAVTVLVGIGVTGGMGGSDVDVAMDAEVAQENAPDDGVLRLEAPEADGNDLAADQQAGEAAPEAAAEVSGGGPEVDDELARPRQPVILDQDEVLDDREAVTLRYGTLDETSPRGYLGTPIAEAEDLAASFRVAVERAAPFASGVRPAACLDVVGGGTDMPVLPLRVESVRYAGEAGLAYVVLTAGPQAEALDRAEVWVVDPATCQTRLFVDVTTGR